jgi:hypothetical protein
MSGNGEMNDKQTKILEDIRQEMRNMRVDMNAGFAAVNARIDQTNDRLDNVIKIVDTHHRELDERVTRIEDHLGLPR